MTAIDARTLSIKLAAPVNTVLSLLANHASGRFVVMPRETDTTFEPRGDMIGSGPFVLTEYRPSGGYRFKRNPEYVDREGIGRPFVDELDYPIISDYPTALAQFKTGAIYSYGPIAANDTLSLKSEVPAIRMYGTDFAGVGGAFTTSGLRFGWFPAGQSPFRDERVRQAFSMAIDRDLYLDVAFEGPKFAERGLPLNYYVSSSMPPGSFAWLDPKSKEFGPNAKFYSHNVAEAKALLAAAGFANGLQVDALRNSSLTFGTAYFRLSDVLDGMVAEAGFRTNPVAGEFSTVFRREWLDTNGRYSGFLHGRSASPGDDPASYFASLFWSKGGIFFLGFDANGRGDISGDPKVDDMVVKLMREFDLDRQRELSFDLQRHLAKPMYGVQLPGSATEFLMAWPIVKNFLVSHTDAGRSGSNNHGVFSWWLDETQPPIGKS